MKKLMLFIPLLVCCSPVFSQTEGLGARRVGGEEESIYHKETEKSYNLIYVTGPFDHKESTNGIIMRMGELTGLPSHNTYKAVFKYTEKTEISRIVSQIELKAWIKPSGITGKTTYRGFNFSTFLIPDRMNFRISLLDASGSMLYEQLFYDVEVSGKENAGQYIEIVGLTLPDQYPTQQMSLRISEIITPKAALLFYHTPSKFSSLQRAAGLVPEYEKDVAKLNAAIKKIRTFNPDHLDRIRDYNSELDRMKQTTDQIHEKDYPMMLIRELGDPGMMMTRLDEFATLYHETKREFQQILANLDKIYTNRGMDFFRKRDYGSARIWFMKAIEINPDHPEANYRLAWIDFQQGMVEESMMRALRIIDHMNPGIQTTRDVQKLIDEIHHHAVQNLIRKAQQAINRGDFPQATAVVDEIFAFYHRYPGLTQDPQVVSLLKQVQSAMQLAGERLIQKRSYAQAYEVLDLCLNFVQKYRLGPSQDLHRMLEEARNGVFVTLLMSGQKAMNARDFNGAEFYLNEALRFLKHPRPPASEVALEAYKTNLLQAYLAEGKRMSVAGDYQKAIEYFEKGQKAQYTFGIRSEEDIQALVIEAKEMIVVRMLAEVQRKIDRKEFNDALRDIQAADSYMQEHFLAGQAKAKMDQTTDNYIRDILLQIDRQNLAGDFHGALSMVDNAWYICDHFPVRIETRLLDQREAVSRSGIYRSMVGEAEAALVKDDLVLAKSRLSDAERYRQLYATYITSGQEAERVMGRIRQKEYQDAMKSGNAMVDKKESRQALAFFDEAFLLESQGGFETDPTLMEQRKKAALQVILAEAEDLERQIGQSSFMTTKDKLLLLLSMRAKYDLQDNREIGAKLQDIQHNMMSAACRQQLETYNSYMDQAYEYARQRRFTEAGVELGKAIDAACVIRECDISDSSAIQYLVQLTPAIRYQEKMAASIKSLEAYRNSEAIEAYLEAEALYHRGNVKVYGIEHEPFADHVVRQNLNYILEAAYMYNKTGSLLETIRMLQILASRGYPSSQTRLLQEQTGYQLGKEDRVKNPGSTWKTAVLQHTSGNRFFRYFRKAYKKGWNS